jgi:hypothetical protein
MPKLTRLDMQMPSMKELKLIPKRSTQLLLNLEVGDRGAQFIAQNMKNLTMLNVCKQWDDSV